MSSLELKISPPLVALSAIALGLCLHLCLPRWSFVLPLLYLWSALFIGLGVSVTALAAMQFKKATTTINPLRPEEASSLVATGIYAWTRNPMYLGLIFVVFGVLLTTENIVSISITSFLVVYLDNFQIQPEERILRQKLKKPYVEYLASVRRWL